MFIDIKQIEDVRTKFVDLGNSIRDTIAINKEAFATISETIEVVGNLSEQLQRLSSLDFSKVVGDLNTLVSGIQKQTGLISKSTETFESLGKSVDAVGQKFSKLAEGGGDEGPGKFNQLLKKEISAITALAVGSAAKLMLPFPGSVLATPLKWVIHGFKDAMKMQAAEGEIKTILVSAVDGANEALVKSAASALNNTQIMLERFYGINRRDYQQTIQAFVEGGVELQKIAKEVDSSLGIAGANLASFALSVEKRLRLPTGSFAKGVTQMMTNYNMGLNKAKASFTEMAFIGRDLGVGVSNFVKSVLSANDSLRQFGADTDSVIKVSVALQESLTKMNLGKQFSGKLVSEGLNELASGLKGMGDGWKMIIGERMGFGEGIVAVHRVESLLQNSLAAQKDPKQRDMWIQFLEELYKFAEETRHGNQYEMYMLFRSIMGSQAAQLMPIFNTLKQEGKLDKDAKSGSDIVAELAAALGVEAEKQDPFQLLMNEWLTYIGQVGRGLMGILFSVTAELVIVMKQIGVYMSHIPELLNPKMLLSSYREELLDKLARMAAPPPGARGGVGLAEAELAAGAEGLLGVGKKFADLLAKSSNKNLNDKLGVSQGGNAPSTGPVVIYVPVQGGSSAPVSRSPGVRGGGLGSGGFLAPGAPPAQGLNLDTLSIVSKGVTPSGDIEIELQGSCPNCGLVFGGSEKPEVFKSGSLTAKDSIPEMTPEARSQVGISDFSTDLGSSYTAKDLEAMSRMLQSEVGGKYKGRERETAAIAHTALNRSRKRGKSLHEVITGGQGFGKQGIAESGKMRPYATAKAPTKSTVDLAKRILSGEIEDPTGGKATGFYHTNPETGILGRKGENRAAFPKFAEKSGILFAEPSGGREDKWVVVTGGGSDTDEGAEAREFLESSFKK